MQNGDYLLGSLGIQSNYHLSLPSCPNNIYQTKFNILFMKFLATDTNESNQNCKFQINLVLRWARSAKKGIQFVVAVAQIDRKQSRENSIH